MTTVKSTNILIQKNSARLSVKVPSEMKALISKYAREANMTDSQYVKLAIHERLEKDKAEVEGK